MLFHRIVIVLILSLTLGVKAQDNISLNGKWEIIFDYNNEG